MRLNESLKKDLLRLAGRKNLLPIMEESQLLNQSFKLSTENDYFVVLNLSDAKRIGLFLLNKFKKWLEDNFEIGNIKINEKKLELTFNYGENNVGKVVFTKVPEEYDVRRIDIIYGLKIALIGKGYETQPEIFVWLGNEKENRELLKREGISLKRA